MEPYLLTQEDIEKLAAMSEGSMNGVPPGAEATPAEIEALGIQPTAVDPAPVAAPVTAPVTAPVAATAADTATSGAATLQQLLALQAPTPAPTYETLSKDQRRMLAFAGLSDAGAALQGGQGGNVNAMFGRFNEQADMQRKATAAQAQRQMLSGIMGGGVGADPQARIQQLLNMAMVNPSMAPAIALQVKQIQDQLQGSTKDVTGSSQAATQLEDVNALINMIDADPSLTTGIMGSLLSYIPGTGANIAEGLATTLRSNLALQALKDLKATGATMGALNETEFTALETELTQLDLSKGPQTSKRALKRIQTKYQNLVADAFRDAEEQAAAGNPIGQKTLEGLNRIFGGKPAWTENAGPVVQSGTQREGESDEDFLKRMREGRG
tara:strand:+ start:3838 stop:4986 length:1149 start_codon:yes stop_codon:yes gene_type:complete